jgi:hypothetical protein
MNKKFLIAWIVVFVVWMFGSYLVHGALLSADYMATKLMRSPEGAQEKFPVLVLAHVIMAGAFVWIYSRGQEAKPWLAQGVRYGIAIALLAVVPTYMIYFAVQPWPSVLVAKQIVFDGILVVILGVVVAWFYRQPANA